METKINVNVTGPQDMYSCTQDMLIQALSSFERLLKEEAVGNTYYHLVCIGEYSRDVCDKVEEIYINAGWKSVKCHTSSENGERPGLTGLILEM